MAQHAPQPDWYGDAAQTAERRDWIRFPPRCREVTCQVIGEQEWLEGEIQDLSSRGIGILLGKAILVGTVLRVRLNPRDLRDKAVLVRVKHVVQVEASQHQVGATFVVPLTAEQLQSLAARS
jgi:hypothetical protein